MSEIEPGNARVRVINLSPDAGDVDLLETGGTGWFNDVGLGKASDYINIAPGTYSADLRGKDDRVLKTFPILPSRKRAFTTSSFWVNSPTIVCNCNRW